MRGAADGEQRRFLFRIGRGGPPGVMVHWYLHKFPLPTTKEWGEIPRAAQARDLFP